MSGSTNFPGALDDSTSLPAPSANTVTNAGSVTHSALHDSEILAIQALETKLGTGASTATASTVLRGTGTGTTGFGQVNLSTDVTGTLPISTGISGLGTGVATFLGTPTSANLATALTDETGSGSAVFATSPTLITPALGTPASGVATNLTGTASGLTAGTVTTNANLTGVITSSGNATSIASQTGTGTKFVVDTTPTLVTPILGVATATSVNKMAITAPATSSTLAVANSKIFTVNNTLTLAGTDSTTMTFPATTGGVLASVTGIATITGTPSSANFLRGDGTWSAPAGGGTVTNTGGNLTANSVILGAGTADVKVVAGIISDGTSKLTLGVAGTSVGSVAFNNATSGSVTLSPITGALGTATLSLPAATDTIVGKATTDTFTNKTISGTTNSVSSQTFSNPYKFNVWRSAAANAGNAAFAQVVFDTKEFDTNSNFATGTYTVPLSGFYQFNTSVNISAGTTFIVSLFKNGSELKRGIQSGNATSGGFSAMVQLAAGDTIDIRTFSNAANALTVGQTTVWFSGFLVSPT